MGKSKTKPAAKKPAAGAKKRKNAPVQKKKQGKAEYPHFRYHKKSRHPALIVGEKSEMQNDKQGKAKKVEKYKYRKVMHGERDGRHLNEKVVPNPDPQDKKPMYIAKRVRSDPKDRFEDKPLPWDTKNIKK